MQALRLYGPGDIRLTDMEIPEIAEDEILLKTEAAAICGTDIRMWKYGREGVDEAHPLTLGHEFCGRIVKAGKKVSGYQEGMRVAMQPNIGCGICDSCVSGNFHLCRNYRAFGINMDGAFAEYVRIPAQAVIRGNLAVLPDTVSSGEAAVIEPLSCAFNGFSKCFVKPGDRALVIGAGPIGMCHAMLLHMAGAVVLVNDIQEDRLAYCRRIFPYITGYAGENLPEYVQHWTGGKGLDVAVVACPVPSVQASVLSLMNYGGRVNFFGGLPAEKEPVAIDTNLIHYRELYLTGSTRSSVSQYRKTMELIQNGLLHADALVTDSYSLSDACRAFENAKQARGMKHVFAFP